MIEGSGAGSGSIPLTNGSGSGSMRPKSLWIWWIRIQIRIRNTALSVVLFCRMQRIYREVEPGVEQRDARHLGQAFWGAQCSGEVHHHRKINIIVIFSIYLIWNRNLRLEALYSVLIIGFFVVHLIYWFLQKIFVIILHHHLGVIYLYRCHSVMLLFLVL